MSDHHQTPRIPAVAWPFAAVAVAYLVVPLLALLASIPWDSLADQLSSDAFLAALGLSVGTALISTLLCVILGVPLALVIVRARGTAKRILRAIVLVPLLLPPVVGGIALLALLGGLSTSINPASFGWGLAAPFVAIVLAQTFVALPFLVLAVERALRSNDGRLAIAAATLGASRATIFRRITLPIVAPGLAAGAVLCFTRALGEFGATVTFGASVPGAAATLPVTVFSQIESNRDAAIVLSLVLLAVSIAAIVALKDRYTGGVS